jgi:dephospho-CoA kinase
MEVWGITGLRGSGKTTATEYLGRKGFPTIDSDHISRLVVDKKTPLGAEGFQKIVKLFGTGVLNSLGDLDRSSLHKQIILNPTRQQDLELIMNPLIHRYVDTLRVEWKSAGTELAVIEGSRLIEQGFVKVTKGIVRVVSDFEFRVKRLQKRDSMGKTEVETMLRMTDNSDLIRRSTNVEWNNDKKMTDLYKQIDAWLEQRLK